MKHYIGVDVGKDSLAIAYQIAEDTWQYDEYTNNAQGIGQFIEELPYHKEAIHVIAESTGVYSKKLVQHLCENGIAVSLLNPKQSSGFAKVMLDSNKTDPDDARRLALFGQLIKPKSYQAKATEQEHLRQLRATLAILIKQRTMHKNRLHALNQEVSVQALVLDICKKQIKTLDQQIAQVEKELQTIVNQAYQQVYDLMISVKGVGPTTAVALIILVGDFSQFQSVKQLAKFLGICPTLHQSGTSVRGKRSISRSGAPHIRALLYLCAISAKRYNTACKAFYDRLRGRGKCHKVALIAVAHKLVKQLFAVVKSGVKFDNNLYKNIEIT